MDDFAAFLTARYDEAEALAREAAKYHGRRWHAGTRIDPTEGTVDLFDDDGANVLAMYVLPGDAAYIADQDPAHRLADVKLKRAILAEHYPVDPCDAHDGELRSTWCATVRQLGTEFAEHAAYKQEWRPE